MVIWLINHYAVPPQYYPLSRQRFFAKYLLRMGHSVRIFAASSVHNSSQNLINGKSAFIELVDDGIDYVLIKASSYEGNGLSRIYNMMQFAWRLPGVLKKYRRPDVIVATSITPIACMQGIRYAKKLGIRGIAEIADLWPESLVAYKYLSARNPLTKFMYQYEKRLYTLADAIIFTMEGGRDYIKDKGWDKEHGGPIELSKIYHINNGVDLEEFNDNKIMFSFSDPDLDDPNTFKVVYAGSIRKANNVRMLLRVAEHLQRIRRNSIRLLVFGEGDERKNLEREAAASGLTNIVFKGALSKKATAYAVTKADLNYFHGRNTLITRWGSSGNKLFDYLAAGKPILSDLTVSYDVIQKYDCGFVVIKPNAQTIANKMVEISELPASVHTQYGYRALQAAKDYDFSVLTRQLIDIMQKGGRQ